MQSSEIFADIIQIFYYYRASNLLASLSDRVGVCCLSLLSKEDKLKAFTSTWALNFGTRFLTEKAER